MRVSVLLLTFLFAVSGFAADGWNDSSSKKEASKSEVKTESKKETKKEAAAEKATPVGELTWSAFVEAGHYWTEHSFDDGFLLKDAALYLTHTYGDTKAVIDLPFGWEGATDTDGDGENDTYSSNYKFAKDKAQTFISHKWNDFEFTIGQFDTLYGYELNDLKDVYFTTQGLVFANALPVTHTGAMAAWTQGAFTAKFMVANANSQGAEGRKQNEYGTQVLYAGEKISGAIGYLYQDEKLEGAESLLDVVATMKLGIVDINAEFDLNNHLNEGLDSKSYMLHPVFYVTDNCSLGARIEYLIDFPTFHEKTQYTIGGQHKINDRLKLKADYTYSGTKATEDSERATDNSAAVAFQYVL